MKKPRWSPWTVGSSNNTSGIAVGVIFIFGQLLRISAITRQTIQTLSKRKLPVPTICVFYGITIRMYYDDHNPPHFHVIYGNFAAKLNIDTGNVIAGNLPGRVLSMTQEWSKIHRTGLIENWRRCQLHEPLQALAPLE
ncbi:MAG: DUF4160 domain-containing protein [Pseudohongiella sp.]|uniref:DUF4160 domain-containing protein n=1 Tax=Pseudohongiella sp. TaxID=1979412 RepID=UPI0034A093F0